MDRQILMPHRVDPKTGQSIEVMKEVGYGRKVILGAGAVSTTVVSLAHMIATADLARKLKLADRKLDLLLAYRRIDQAVALERIYASARDCWPRLSTGRRVWSYGGCGRPAAWRRG